MKKENKIIILCIVITILVAFLLTIVSVYFLSRPKYSLKEDIKENNKGNQITTSSISITYNKNELMLDDMSLSNIYEPTNYIEFKLTGTNTSNDDVLYQLYLLYGENSKSKNIRIKDKLLNFKFVEIKNNKEEILFVNKNYKSLENSIVFKDIIKVNEDINRTFRLYVYISDSIKIGNSANSDYSSSIWKNNVYASVKIKMK